MRTIATTHPAGNRLAAPEASLANHRRRVVFTVVLVGAAAASLGWVFLQPAQYRATARWQFTFPERESAAASAQVPPPAADPAFLTELQVITSRPLLQQLRNEMQARGLALPGTGEHTAEALQRGLQAQPVAGTTVVEVQAEGPQAEPLAPLVNVLFDVYRRQLEASHHARSGDASVQARDEVAALQARVAERRRALDEFRARHDIVSAEGQENQVLAQARDQGSALTVAGGKVVAAEARLRTLRAAVAAGKAVTRARDDPTLANLEQRHSQAREELRALERVYTEAYMALDPNAKALRVRVANLEEQIRQAREAAQQAALAEAEEELAAARAAADRMAQDMGSARQGVQSFAAHLAEYKGLREDLSRLEALHGAAVARAAALDTGSRRAAPGVRLLEPASTPLEPWRPNYARDAAAAGAGSLLLALLAVGLLELLNRPAAPPTVVMEPAWSTLGPPPQAWPLGQRAALRPLPGAGLATPLLESTAPERELDDAEVSALIRAAAGPAQAMVLALLAGAAADELVALNRGDLDPAARTLRLSDRTLALPGALPEMLAGLSAGPAGSAPEAPLFAAADGRRLSVADIEAGVVFAAHDGGLDGAAEVDAGALRHTCVAHLVRQGARFGDLARWVGRLPSEALGTYGALSPAGPKRAAEDIDPLLPAVRRWAERAAAAGEGTEAA
jgi:uncharacterized protein involved in exopolysaccharide biosynthesis